jgi:hypothetical protein
LRRSLCISHHCCWLLVMLVLPSSFSLT